MALVNVKERWSGVNGQIEKMNIEGAQRGVGARAYTVLFDAVPALYDVIDAAGIPAIGWDGTPGNPTDWLEPEVYKNVAFAPLGITWP